MSDAGREAFILIQQHIKDCDRRYGELRETLRDNRRATEDRYNSLDEKMDGMNGRIAKVGEDVRVTIYKASWGLVGLLLAVVGYLLVSGRPWE